MVSERVCAPMAQPRGYSHLLASVQRICEGVRVVRCARQTADLPRRLWASSFSLEPLTRWQSRPHAALCLCLSISPGQTLYETAVLVLHLDSDCATSVSLNRRHLDCQMARSRRK